MSVLTDGPFEFTVDGVTYVVVQTGIMRKEADGSYTELPIDEGTRVYDAFLAQEG